MLKKFANKSLTMLGTEAIFQFHNHIQTLSDAISPLQHVSQGDNKGDRFPKS